MGVLVALALAGTRALAAAQVAGFAATTSAVMGWSMEPLTSTRKLVLVSLASLLLCAVVESRAARWRPATAFSCTVLAGGTVWMLWRLLVQKDPNAALFAGAAAALYVAAQTAMFLRAGADPVRAAAAGSALAFGTGAAAILGATAVLGTLALAVGSAAMSTLAVQFARNATAPVGRSIALPAAAVSALAGVNATFTAELPWYVLPPLLLAAPAAHLVPAATPVRVRALAAFAIAIVPAAAAVALAWFRPA